MPDTYNDGGLRFGSQTIEAQSGATTSDMTSYILESLTFTRGSDWAGTSDADGVPNKAHGRITVPTGDASLQLEDENTPPPEILTDFIAKNLKGEDVPLIITQVGEVTGNEVAAKVNIQVRKKINL